MRRSKWCVLAAILLALTVSAKAQTLQQSGTVTPNHIATWVTDGVVKDGGLGPTELVNGNFIEYLDTIGHHRVTGSTPALTSCGTSPSISGTDIAGLVTMGTVTPTGCVITFANAHTNVPYCTVTWQANLASMQYTISATAITLVQTATSSNKVNYRCDAQSGG